MDQEEFKQLNSGAGGNSSSSSCSDETTRRDGAGRNGLVMGNGLVTSSTDMSLEGLIEEEAEEWKQEVDVTYRVDEAPTFALCLLLGFQHYISMFVATLSVPILLAPKLCMNEDHVGKSEMTGTLFVASGIITLLQTTLGVRLPIVQGGTFAILVPTLAYLNLPKMKCPDNILPPDATVNATLGGNSSYILTGSDEHREIWMMRLREIQGSIMCAAIFEVVMGASGVIGIMLRFIGPLTICPTVTLLGLALFRSAASMAAKQWWIGLLTMVLMALFSQYLDRIYIPCGRRGAENSCCRQNKFPIFKMFPVILSVVTSWLICAILTETNVLPNNSTHWGYEARTDLRLNAIYASPWFRVPYPGQWGIPTVSISAVCAMLSGILATTVESVGDYHACAKLSGAPPPPLHAVNRGILIEGIGTFIDGCLGTGNGTTSTSINVGVVGITKVGSRRVVQFSAVFMMLFGVFTKFGALFIMIPDPVIGGTFFILFGMIVAVGISSLQTIDMNSSRNLFIIGVSLFSGLAIPQWMMANTDSIKTGSEVVDNICVVLLSTSMFVGGFVGFVLDNTIRGTAEERGIAHWKRMRAAAERAHASPHLQKRMAATYNLPFGMSFLRRHRFFSYLPFSPTYRSQCTTAATDAGEAGPRNSQPIRSELTSKTACNGRLDNGDGIEMISEKS